MLPRRPRAPRDVPICQRRGASSPKAALGGTTADSRRFCRHDLASSARTGLLEQMRPPS
jgi:hypothetical protein